MLLGDTKYIFFKLLNSDTIQKAPSSALLAALVSTLGASLAKEAPMSARSQAGLCASIDTQRAGEPHPNPPPHRSLIDSSRSVLSPLVKAGSEGSRRKHLRGDRSQVSV